MKRYNKPRRYRGCGVIIIIFRDNMEYKWSRLLRRRRRVGESLRFASRPGASRRAATDPRGANNRASRARY